MKEHFLHLKAIDRAGNEQQYDYRFMKLDLPDAIDDSFLLQNGSVVGRNDDRTDAEWSEAVLEGNVRSVAGGLGQYVQGFEGNYGSPGYAYTNAYRDGLDYLQRLMRAAAAVDDPGLQPQMRDAKFLSHLVNLGGAYAALNPSRDGQIGFFLDTLWSDHAIGDRPVNELENFLVNQSHPLEQLGLDARLLTSLRFISETRNSAHTPEFLNAILDWSGMYWRDRGNNENDLFVYDPGNLFENLATMKTHQEIAAWCGRTDWANTGVADSAIGVIGVGFQLLYVDPIVNANVPVSIYDPDSTEKSYARFHIPFIIRECFARKVSDPAQIAYILATAAIESRWGRYKLDSGLDQRLVEKTYSSDLVGTPEEINYFRKYDALYGNKRDINGRPDYQDDYYQYRGRGYVQITYRDNYRRVSQTLWNNRVLEYSPEQAEKPQIAAQILVEGMKRGLFVQVETLKDYINSKQRLFHWEAARNLVNPGEGYSNTEARYKIARLAEIYYSILKRGNS
jgi:predicted chitinase